ncbi:GFA family protein [Denitrobaculum tricleocarpae]|nr:GFA family protein [Denitrobaculum tricleocarpae]
MTADLLELAFPARSKRRNLSDMPESDVSEADLSGKGTVTRGVCLCGAVAFEVGGPLEPVVNCHCGQCRKMTGHYLASTNASHEDFRFIRDGGLKWYHASDTARRGFCRDCGATLFWEQHGSGRIAIAAGSLEKAPGLTTAGHIFVADKAAYYDLEDGLPQFAQDGEFKKMTD